MRISAVWSLLLLFGCTPGEITSGPGSGGPSNSGVDAGPNDPDPDPDPGAPDAAPPDYSLALTNATADTILGTTTELEVVLSSDNFQGSIALTAEGVPSTWEVSFTPSIVSVPRNGTATAIMSVVVPTDGEATSASITVNGSGGPGVRSQVSTINVANEVVVEVATGTGDNDHAFPAPMNIRLGTQVTIANGDGVNHRIHSGNDDAGFPHQENNMGQGEAYTFTLTRAGSFVYYCHIHDVQAGVGRIVVSE